MIETRWISPRELKPGMMVTGWRNRHGRETVIAEKEEDAIRVTEIDEERDEVKPDLGLLSPFDWQVMVMAAPFEHPNGLPGSTEEDLEVTGDQLQVGDRYIGYRDSLGPTWWGLDDYEISKVWRDSSGTVVFDIIRPQTRREVCSGYALRGNAKYFIRRGKNANNGFKDAKIDLGSLKKADSGDRFPHRCTGCGGRAYIGLFSIEHEDPKVTCQAK